MNRLNRKFDHWINKKRYHFFDTTLTSVALALSLPLVYVVYRFTHDRFSTTTVNVILFVAIILFSGIGAQLIGRWIDKKPADSNWRKY